MKVPVVPTAFGRSSAKGKLDVAKASLERTETLLGFAKIAAPFSGVITKRMVDPGAVYTAATSGSAAQNAAIVTLTDFNRVRVQVAVPELETFSRRDRSTGQDDRRWTARSQFRRQNHSVLLHVG